MIKRNKLSIYTPKSFEADSNQLSKINRKYDTSANIFHSMLLSEKWQSLTKNQRLLYVYCKAQYYGKDKRTEKNLLTYLEILENRQVNVSNRFFFNRDLWINTYGLYKNNGQFYKDMNALIESGFIGIVENNANTRKKNIYEFSDGWRVMG